MSLGTFTYLGTSGMWYFGPWPCRHGEGAAQILPSIPLKRIRGRWERDRNTFPSGWEGELPAPKASPHFPICFDLLSFPQSMLCCQPLPHVPRCCWSGSTPSFRQSGESRGFPWENMLWDAIRAKNMQPLSSTLISENKTQGFLPSGVSDQQEKGKSEPPVGAFIKHFWQGAQPFLSWRKLRGLTGAAVRQGLTAGCSPSKAATGSSLIYSSCHQHPHSVLKGVGSENNHTKGSFQIILGPQAPSCPFWDAHTCASLPGTCPTSPSSQMQASNQPSSLT